MRSKRLYKLLKPPRGFKLTKAGKIFFAFLLAIIVVSMATGNNLLFLILASLLAFMIVSGIESEMNIRHLDVSRSLAPELFAGVSTTVSYTIRNSRRDSVRLLLEDGERSKLGFVKKGFAESIRVEKVFRKRGIHRLGGVSVSTTFPYGLFEKSISFDLEDEAVVFPEPVACTYPVSCGPSGESSGGVHDSISHVRPYAPGDPFSSIVWKKQHLGLISRVIQGGGGLGSLIMVLPGGDIEDKLGKAAFLILEMWKSNQAFGLSINDFTSGMGSSSEHKLNILRVLALTQSIGTPAHGEISGDDNVIYL